MTKRLLALLMCLLTVISMAGCVDGAIDTPDEPDVTKAPELSDEVTTTEATTTEATTAESTATEAATTTEATTTEDATTTVTTTEATTVTTTEATTVTTTEATTATTTAKAEPEYGDPKYVVINEVCSSAKNSVTDFEGKSPDWIELYNPSDFKVNLKGYAVSDDPSNLMKWVLPEVEIEAGGYLIIFCSDKDTVKNGELHTNFKLSGGNETVYLVKPDGKAQDKLACPETDSDLTYARYPDGSDKLEIIPATPGKKNSSAKAVDELAMPVFSKRSGFYNSQFNLKLTAEEGATIYYTTDGSVPTTSSKKYSSFITIKDISNQRAVLTYKKPTTVGGDEQLPKREFEKATIIRAIAVDKSGKKSDVATATYFIGEDIAKKYANVRVISVVADPDDLYDYNKGIYVPGKTFDDWRKENPGAELDGSAQGNYNQRGSEWERPAHIDYFSSSSKLEFSEDVGIRTHGGWSRNTTQKSLRFYFRSEYGESKLNYKLFDENYAYDNGKEIKSFKRFMIRNGGNDNFTLKYKDQWTQSLFVGNGFNFATQTDALAVVFLDGEYWGIYQMSEVYDKYFIEDHYGVDKDDVVMYKAGRIEEGEQEGDENLYWDAYNFIADNDMSKEANYEKACELFDMDSFCDYIAAETYIGNQDWIWNNVACWRTRSVTKDSEFGDGKWRFMMYDTEFSMDLYGNGSNYREEYITDLLKGDGYYGEMLVSLLKNKDFVHKLVCAYEAVMNIAFDIDYASDKLEEYHKEYAPFLDDHFDRFVDWQSEWGVKNNKDSFKKWIRNRYDYFLPQLSKLLKLDSKVTNSVQLERTAGGDVYVDGKRAPFENGRNPDTWDGMYLSGYKITLKAVPKEGYEFVGWQGAYSGKEDSIRVNPTKTIKLKAVFKKK